MFVLSREKLLKFNSLRTKIRSVGNLGRYAGALFLKMERLSGHIQPRSGLFEETNALHRSNNTWKARPRGRLGYLCIIYGLPRENRM
jgi:hypothetical protein